MASDILACVHLERCDAGLVAARVGTGADHAVDGVSRQPGKRMGNHHGHRAVKKRPSGDFGQVVADNDQFAGLPDGAKGGEGSADAAAGDVEADEVGVFG